MGIAETKPKIEPETEASSENLLDIAVKSAERLEKANTEFKALLDRHEKIVAQDMLGGRSTAGQQPQAPKIETPKEYKDRIMRGDFDRRV